VNDLATNFGLNEEELNEALPSGKQPRFRNRVGWSRTYLKKAGLLEYPRRATMKITQKGLDVLRQSPSTININFLKQFPEFAEFRSISREDAQGGSPAEDVTEERKTPDELIEEGYNLIRSDLAQELLAKLRNNSAAFFEKVVLDILSAMGYGKGEVLGQSGDGGVDGIIYQDKLGLDKIIFQAKRYAENNPVTPTMVRDFIGALDTRRVNKGVFITTSRFSVDAENIVQQSQKSVVLINGVRLVNLMIDYDLGVASNKVFHLKTIDSDYFIEE
jgi:Restriction endonuclease